MKKFLLKNEKLLNFLSITVLGIFVLVAVASVGDIDSKTEYLGDGVYQTKYYKMYYEGDDPLDATGAKLVQTVTGKQDDKGRWHGTVEVNHYPGNQIATMVHGKKEGKSTYTDGDGKVTYICYSNDKKVDCNKSASISNSSFDILQEEFFVEYKQINSKGFDDTYLQNFFGELEAEIGQHTFEFEEFADYYEEAIDILSETEYDSLLQFNNWLTGYRRMDMLKNNVFRLATIERNLTEGASTFNILKNTYPGFIDFILAYNEMVESEINEDGINTFCDDYDARFDALSPLNVEDPLFVDSINNRMYRIISEMYEGSTDDVENKSAQLKWAINNFNKTLTIRSAKSYLKSASSDLNGVYVEIVLASMVADVVDGDIIYNCVEKAWIKQNNIVVAPTLGTLSEGGDGISKASVAGNILEDGGSEVTARGIVWAETYDPTTDNNKIESGSGLGEFSVEITGLENNKRYFARAFAVSDIGTSYGNCVEFSTAITTSTDIIEQAEFEFDIYPNPASNIANLSFSISCPEEINVIVSNMQGQIVLQKKLGLLNSGTHSCELNLTELETGMYNCTIISGNSKAIKKLIVSR